jgi:fumarate reductase flavoprotein subunit
LPNFPNQVPTWHLINGGGARLIKVLAEDCQQRGVTLLTQTPAKKLLAEKGQVTGVLAEKGGKEFQIEAKSVIIASGGYGANKELLKKYSAEYRDNMKLVGIGYDGDGLLMATSVGAATEGLGILLLYGPCIDSTADASTLMTLGEPPDTISIPLMSLVLEPNILWVNKLGQRFADESVSINLNVSANTAVRQPGNLVYTLFDSALVTTLMEQGLIMGGPTGKDTRGKQLLGLARELKAKADRGLLKIADTWDEIAGWIGAAPEILKTTVAEYNDACEHGYDPVFVKNRRYLSPLRVPPYYVLQSHAEFHGTIGGIKINENMEVIDHQFQPIPGLYAAGVDTGGWETETYAGDLSGHAFGFAVNSGRIAGENAAKPVIAI